MSAVLGLAALALTVWAIDDGEKISHDQAPTKDNPVWTEGQPIRLFGMRNESVAFQVAVRAGDEPLEGVTVDVGAVANGNATLDIERFVEHYFDVPRHSGGVHPGESLGWVKGSGPKPNEFVGSLPDALIPISAAPTWDPYPMKVSPQHNGVVWIDLWIAKDRPAGLYRADVVVRAGDRTLATLPLEVDVHDAVLAEQPVPTMLYYAKSELDHRIGLGPAEEQLLRLFHQHRVAPMHGVTNANELEEKRRYLDGSFYAKDYEGPAKGIGDRVLAIGPYGSMGAPSRERLAPIAQKIPVEVDAFVYAADEDCRSPLGKQWHDIVKEPGFERVRVGWTCSEDPRSQPVDIVMQWATFDEARATEAKEKQRRATWTYNGLFPRTGSFLTDTSAIAPRVNGWLAAMYEDRGLGRWFYWESTFWYDGNKGGHGPYDPFVTAETFHNKDGDWAMGDGVLVYPGKQIEYPEHSLGIDGVIPSIRLKNWRRGIEDAGYLQLARRANPAAADAIAKKLIPKAFSETKDGEPASWSDSGKRFFDARRALLALIPKGADGGLGNGALPLTGGHATEAGGCDCRGCSGQSRSSFGFALFGAFVFRRALRRSTRAQASNRKSQSPGRPRPPANRD